MKSSITAARQVVIAVQGRLDEITRELVAAEKLAPMWTVESAAKFVQWAHPFAYAAGWNLHLGGSVLTAGFSRKDLDVLAVPRFQVQESLWSPLLNVLYKDGWELKETKLIPNREVSVVKKDDKVVDLIFLNRFPR